MTESQLFRTYVMPFVVFLSLSLLLWVAESSWAWDHPSAGWYRRAPEMWVYPLQVLVCGWYVWRVRRDVEWDWKLSPCLLGAAAGVVGIGFWLVPYVTGWIPAEPGFEPEAVFGENTAAIWVEYGFRFARAVIIVALVEEFFWRGYLMRWCVNRDFPQTVALGQGSWLGYAVVTLAFMLVHRPVDYAGAIVFGSLAYGLVVYTRRLTPALVMHAVANLIMGICAIKLNLPHLW